MGYEEFQRAAKIMAKIGLRMPKIRALGVTASSLYKELYQPLFVEQKRREALVKTVDEINGRF